MNYESISDIYVANQKFREGLRAELEGVSDEESTALPDGEKWSVQQLAEHVAIVDNGISRICAKLLAQSEPQTVLAASAGFSLSPHFGEKLAEVAASKLEAPDQVQPTGSVTIEESLRRIDETRGIYDQMRADFERLDFAGQTFPHPFLGNLTAGEWLVMAGLHKYRHTKQIRTLLAKIRQ